MTPLMYCTSSANQFIKKNTFPYSGSVKTENHKKQFMRVKKTSMFEKNKHVCVYVYMYTISLVWSAQLKH